MFLSYGRDIGYSVTQFVYRGAVYSIFFPFFCFVDLGSCDFLIYCSKGLYGTFWYRTSCALSVYREEANSPSLSTLYECIFYKSAFYHFSDIAAFCFLAFWEIHLHVFLKNRFRRLTAVKRRL